MSEIPVPNDLPEDPLDAYLTGFQYACEMAGDTSHQMAVLAQEKQGDEDAQTAWHDAQTDGQQCPDCGAEQQWNPADGAYICMNC